MKHRHTMIIIITAWIGIILILLWAYTYAPGAQTPPGQSQNGKSDSLDRGGSFNACLFFEHNAISQPGTGSKLHPRSGLITHILQDGQTIFGKCVWVTNLFNIILIISQTPAKEYMVELSTSVIHNVHNSCYSQVGNTCQIETYSQNDVFIALVISVRTHGNDRTV